MIRFVFLHTRSDAYRIFRQAGIQHKQSFTALVTDLNDTQVRNLQLKCNLVNEVLRNLANSICKVLLSVQCVNVWNL